MDSRQHAATTVLTHYMAVLDKYEATLQVIRFLSEHLEDDQKSFLAELAVEQLTNHHLLMTGTFRDDRVLLEKEMEINLLDMLKNSGH